MLMNLATFTHPGRKVGKFVDMSHFIKTKNSDQCRSHHQKMMKKTSMECDLKRFLMEEYEERLLDAEQIVREMTDFLTKHNPNYVKAELIPAKMSIIRENWKKVMSGATKEEAEDHEPAEDLDTPTKCSNNSLDPNHLENVQRWPGIEFLIYEEENSFA
jgi:hypothetical protein